MKSARRLSATLLSTALSLALVAPLAASPKRWLEESETVKRSFVLTAAGTGSTAILVVDNILGSIDVRAGSGDKVELTLVQRYAGRAAEDLVRAREEVELEVRESAGKLELVQGGPWRCGDKKRSDGDRDRDADEDWNWGDGCCCGGHGRDGERGDRDWEVTYDWTLTVPRSLDLTVRNVNDGDIRIAGVTGRLRVRHVNDDVTLENVGGSLDARTVNGELKVEFASLPTGPLTFTTVNGDVDVAFPSGLGAELAFETMNGEVYTDFPFTMNSRQPPPVATSDERGRHRRSTGRQTRAILGKGGIEIECSTINGDITIRERG